MQPPPCGRRVALALAGLGAAPAAATGLGPLEGRVQAAPEGRPWRVFLEDGGLTLENAADASWPWEMTVPVHLPFRASIVVRASGTANQPAPGAGAGLLVGYHARSVELRSGGGRRQVDHTIVERLLLRPDGEVRILRSVFEPAYGNRVPRHGWGGVLARTEPGRAVRLAVAEANWVRTIVIDDGPPIEHQVGDARATSWGRAGVVAIGLGIFRLREIAFTPAQRRDKATR